MLSQICIVHISFVKCVSTTFYMKLSKSLNTHCKPLCVSVKGRYFRIDSRLAKLGSEGASPSRPTTSFLFLLLSLTTNKTFAKFWLYGLIPVVRPYYTCSVLKQTCLRRQFDFGGTDFS